MASGATKYYLDVATDSGFTSIVSGYNNLDVGNNLSSVVTGLSQATTCYYRVRANNIYGTSGNSGTINVTTLANAPTVTASAATGVTVNAATLNGSITANNGASITDRGFAYGTSSGVYTTTNRGHERAGGMLGRRRRGRLGQRRGFY